VELVAELVAVMTAENFGAVMSEVFAHEGGYVNDPRDPGGATNMGITIGTLSAWRGKPVTPEDVRALTKGEALAIYRARYWVPVRGGDLPEGLDLVAMDGAVNSGVSCGARWLQQGVGLAPDGKVGAATIEAARLADEGAIARACEARMGFLEGLRTWAAFGRGWSRRVASVQAVATRMWLAANVLPESVAERMAAAKAKAEVEAREAQAQGTKGAAGTAGAGGAAAAGGDAASLPIEALIAIGVVAVVIALVIAIRARRKAAFKRDVAELLARGIEE
jgi:lysozyme family protein